MKEMQRKTEKGKLQRLRGHGEKVEEAFQQSAKAKGRKSAKKEEKNKPQSRNKIRTEMLWRGKMILYYSDTG